MKKIIVSFMIFAVLNFFAEPAFPSAQGGVPYTHDDEHVTAMRESVPLTVTSGELPGVTWVDDIHPIFVRKDCGHCHTKGNETITDELLISIPLTASHRGVYPVKRPHDGMNIKPRDAFSILKAKPDSSFIVDVRSRYEYQDIGHAEGAYNIPVFFYSTETGPKGYKMVLNDNFCSDLKERFRTGEDSLFMICRSGERSTTAAAEAIKCGFSKERVYSILGGFEGDKVHEKSSPFRGKRMVGGWRLEGLPWTYKMNPNLMYLPDLRNAPQ